MSDYSMCAGGAPESSVRRGYSRDLKNKLEGVFQEGEGCSTQRRGTAGAGRRCGGCCVSRSGYSGSLVRRVRPAGKRVPLKGPLHPAERPGLHSDGDPGEALSRGRP